MIYKGFVLYKLLITSFILFALFGCGGSSDDSTSPKSANTPPILSGIFTLDAKAENETIVILNTADAESDTITFSVENSPSWLIFSQSDNQITLKMKPSFFDIKTHELKFNLSDGKDQKQYIYTVNVIDNKDKWEQQNTSEIELLGSWNNKDLGISFAFIDNNTGFYINQDKNYAFDWSIYDSVELSTHKLLCANYCDQIEFIELDVIAKNSDMMRVNITDEQGSRAINLSKQVKIVEENLYYLGLPQEDYNSISELNFENEITTAYLTFNDINIGNLSISTEAMISGSIASSENVYEFMVDPNSSLITEGKTGRFDMVYGGYQDLTFDVVIDKLIIKPISENKVIFLATYHAELKTDLVGQDESDFIGLTDTLLSKKSSTLAQFSPRLSTPEIISGMSYTGKLFASSDDNNLIIDGTDYHSGMSVYTFDNQTKGHAELKVAGKNTGLTLPFSWNKTENSLNMTINGKSSIHEFYRLPDGNIGITYNFTNSSGFEFKSAYKFIELSELTLKKEDYLGIWEHLSDSYHSQELFMVIDDSGLGSYSTPYTSYDFFQFWKFEDDKSISFIYNNVCPQSDNYDDCYQFGIDNFESNKYMSVRNLKLLDVKNNIHTFQYSYWAKTFYEDKLNESAYQSLRTFTKVEN